jgi:hypothetical protein
LPRAESREAATRDLRPAWCGLTARVLKQDLNPSALRPSADMTGKVGEEFLRSHASARFIFSC